MSNDTPNTPSTPAPAPAPARPGTGTEGDDNASPKSDPKNG